MADSAADQALLTAASRDNAAGVRAALAEGADLNARDSHGQTALLFAVQRNDLALALDLIRRGADLNAEALNHDTPWLLAVRSAAPRCWRRCWIPAKSTTPSATATAATR